MMGEIGLFGGYGAHNSLKAFVGFVSGLEIV
jgi:hypothetical protein